MNQPAWKQWRSVKEDAEERIRAAVAAEREACARLADLAEAKAADLAGEFGEYGVAVASEIATAIRERSNQ